MKSWAKLYRGDGTVNSIELIQIRIPIIISLTNSLVTKTKIYWKKTMS